MTAMSLQSHDFDVLIKHHFHEAVVEHMAVVAVHQYLVQFVQLTSCMEVVDQNLSILSKEELIDVAFLRTPHHH